MRRKFNIDGEETKVAQAPQPRDLEHVLEVQYVDPHSLAPYNKNARVIPQAAVDKVAQSLQAFSFQQPIVVDENNVIIVGHTRHKAALQLGYTKVPITVARNLTPEQVRAYRLADNRTNQETLWDLDILREELVSMKDDYQFDDVQMAAVTAFDVQELDAYMAAPVEEEPEPEVVFKTKKAKKADKDPDTECTCPNCGHVFDSASSLDDEEE